MTAEIKPSIENIKSRNFPESRRNFYKLKNRKLYNQSGSPTPN